MKRVLLVLPLLLLLALPSYGQTATTFSLTASPLMVPGSTSGGSTLAATITGINLTITPNFDLRQDNIITTDTKLQGYFGGFNYRIPQLSAGLNSISPNLNGYNFQFYITGSAGADVVNGARHYAFLAGGGLNYKLTSGGAWTLGAEVRYAKLPGYNNNTMIVSVGPTFHF
jgi:hypothetical protein